MSSFSSITKQVSVKIWIKISKQSVFLSFSKASTSLNNATNFQHYYHFLSKILPDTEQLIKGIVGITIGHKRHSNLSHRKISVTVNFKSWKTFMENFGSQKTSGSQKNLSCRKIWVTENFHGKLWVMEKFELRKTFESQKNLSHGKIWVMENFKSRKTFTENFHGKLSQKTFTENFWVTEKF